MTPWDLFPEAPGNPPTAADRPEEEEERGRPAPPDDLPQNTTIPTATDTENTPDEQDEESPAVPLPLDLPKLGYYGAYPPFKESDWRGPDPIHYLENAEGKYTYQASTQVRNAAEFVVDDATHAHKGDERRHAFRQHPWCVECEHIRYGYDPFIKEFHPLPRNTELNKWYREVCLYRAVRWLTLNNNRPPLDDYDPADDEARYLTGETATDSGILGELLSRDELDDLPEPSWMIDRILTRHAYAVLSGRRSTYKSFLALDWSLSLATARPWQGRPTEQTRVLYVAAEGAYGLEQRVAAWEKAWGIQVDGDWFDVLPRGVNLFKGTEIGELLQVIREGAYGLVVIDTLRRCSSGADANTERDMGLIVDRLDRIKRATADGSVLVVAHTDKGNNGTRGSSVIEDDSDIVWRTDVDEGRLKLSCSKMKDAADGAVLDLRAKVSGGSLIIEAGTDTAAAPSTESQIKLLDTLRFSFPDGAHSGKLLAASGLPARTFYRVVAELIAAGHVINSGTKRRPFYELQSV